MILELDQEKITHNYKIIPYSWGYHMGGDAKREKEEFKAVWERAKERADEMKEEKEEAISLEIEKNNKQGKEINAILQINPY
ncbi:MAG: hypothetical protein IH931_06680, partial [candidate division Zixibacteria bacterium]|nr:hypothetical protein [candidate division Zixibacteria bacterium]